MFDQSECVTVSDLVERLGVSRVTARADLDSLRPLKVRWSRSPRRGAQSPWTSAATILSSSTNTPSRRESSHCRSGSEADS